jgi:Cu/Ag efflux protein CusF
MKAMISLPAALLLLSALPALAQAPNAVVAVGIVERIDAASLAVKDPSSSAVAQFALSPKLVVLQYRQATLADIKPGDYVASAAVRGTDGKLHSTEVRIFPEAMRGVSEGQRPMNDPRNQVMTNATVTGAAIANGSNNVTVKLAAGDSELVVDPGVPVTRIDQVDLAEVKTGARVRVQGTKDADAVTATRITLQ